MHPHLNKAYIRISSSSRLSTAIASSLQLALIVMFFATPAESYLELLDPSSNFLLHSRYSSFLTMSSLFYSTLGMGGSASKGSIQQPLVELEVVPISDSSLEEFPHKASESGSSSFERLTDLSHVGEGSSQHCEGVETSITTLEKEHIPITTILPFPLSVANGRGDDNRVRVSPRNRCRHGGEVPSSPPFVASFK